MRSGNVEWALVCALVNHERRLEQLPGNQYIRGDRHEDHPPPRKPPRIASRQPSDKASRPRLVASIPIKSTRTQSMTIPPATYVKIRCSLPFVSATPRNGPVSTARMSKRQPHPRSLDRGRRARRRG